MRKFILSLAILYLGTSVNAQEFHSIWIVPKKTVIGEATFGSGSVRRDGRDWEISIPAGRIPAGSYVEWDSAITTNDKAPEKYVAEYFDKGGWIVADTLNLSHEALVGKEYYTEIHTLKLEDAIGHGNIQLRLRAVSEGEGYINFCRSDNTAMSICWLGTQTPKDTTKVLCIGNSFTYAAGSEWMLKEIAWSQGHYLDMQASLKGGRTFGHHLELFITREKIALGGYDAAFLQNQSQTNAWYWQDRKGKAGILQDAVALAGRVRETSPKVKIFIESTWAYPGKENGGFSSIEEFDRLLAKGSGKIARATRSGLSPIGKAFATCRSERPDIKLFAKDDKHQNEYGAYLKACVNYLCIFRTKFGSGASDCSLDPEKTAYLRSLAERTVKGIQ